ETPHWSRRMSGGTYRPWYSRMIPSAAAPHSAASIWRTVGVPTGRYLRDSVFAMPARSARSRIVEWGTLNHRDTERHRRRKTDEPRGPPGTTCPGPSLGLCGSMNLPRRDGSIGPDELPCLRQDQPDQRAAFDDDRRLTHRPGLKPLGRPRRGRPLVW